jgi:hypothetical protein
METPNSEAQVSQAAHASHIHEVTVIVDGVEQKVPKGTYLVSQFKALVGVDAARELDEVVHGQLKPLDDNAEIVIKGGEKFVSHVRTGGSS